ncbi:MAG: hypothetical protein Q4G64_10760, partial [bacterium]|nr:hypothetical protein [bacterium]
MNSGTAEPATNPGPEGSDPYLWLEDVEGESALLWVNEKNAAAEATLHTDRQREIEQQILEVLDSDDRIPAVVQRGEYLYNFWTDKDHERGLWRRTTWDSYRTDSPEWDVLLDVDALGKEEGVNWVWHGASVLYPSRDRALISLSRGGSDADITREFDLTTRTFIEGGFSREESKGGLVWADTTGESALVFTDTGEGSMTRSGYPRTVRRWRRGTPFESAELLYEGEMEDMYIGAGFDSTPGFERTFVQRAIAFYDSELYELRGDSLELIAVPRSAEASVWREWLLVTLRDPWTVGNATYPSGALLAIPYEEFREGSEAFTVLFTPSPTTSLGAATATRHHVVVTLLDDVRNRLEVLTPPVRGDSGPDDDGGWRRRDLDLTALGDGADEEALRFATIAVAAVDARESDDLWVTTQSYLSPSTLGHLSLDPDGEPLSYEPLKSSPSFFDPSGMQVEQHFAISDDGTRVPYFQVTPARGTEGAPNGGRGEGSGAGSAEGAPSEGHGAGTGALSTEDAPSDGRCEGAGAGSTKGAPSDGRGEGAGEGASSPGPTLLYGYGGFEIALLPAYNASAGRAWLARGGTYVVANI